MMTSLLLAIVIGISSRFLSDELKQWFDWLNRTIRRRAVRRLPERLRARYEEEWESSLQEAPGEIARLVYSLGLLRAAAGIRRAAVLDALASDQPLPILKRLFDFAIAFSVLAISGPSMLLIAALIKLSSPGPAILPVPTLGRGGRKFARFKFRTMAIDDSPRITGIGRFLRTFLLDELPTLYNVLRGDMSIVGRSPVLPASIHPSDVKPLFLNLPPGICNVSEDHSSESDCLAENTYTRDWNLWLDVKIVLRTLRETFSPR